MILNYFFKELSISRNWKTILSSFDPQNVQEWEIFIIYKLNFKFSNSKTKMINVKSIFLGICDIPFF